MTRESKKAKMPSGIVNDNDSILTPSIYIIFDVKKPMEYKIGFTMQQEAAKFASRYVIMISVGSIF